MALALALPDGSIDPDDDGVEDGVSVVSVSVSVSVPDDVADFVVLEDPGVFVSEDDGDVVELPRIPDTFEVSELAVDVELITPLAPAVLVPVIALRELASLRIEEAKLGPNTDAKLLSMDGSFNADGFASIADDNAGKTACPVGLVAGLLGVTIDVAVDAKAVFRGETPSTPSREDCPALSRGVVTTPRGLREFETSEIGLTPAACCRLA